jgi:hypothetical protein
MGTLDAVSISKAILAKWNAPASILGSLVGIDSGRLSQYFSGKLAVPNTIAVELEKTARDLDAVCECFAPAKLDFRDFLTIRMLLEKKRAGLLYARVIVESSEGKE